MITNFLNPEERKNIIKVKIPQPPPYIDKTLAFCFLLCLCALVSVVRQGEIAASIIFGMILFANSLIIAGKFSFSRKIRKHYNNIKAVHKIFDTPTMIEHKDFVEFTFITPSENLTKEIEKAHDLLIKELG